MSYLRLLALFILKCSTNMSFLARFFSDNFISLEKNELGALFCLANPGNNFCKGSELCCASDLTFLAPLTSEI